jgi:threonine dehydratase
MLNTHWIEQAAKELQPHLIRTPIEYSSVLSQLLGVPIYLKLEFLQHTGSFKWRGGLYAISRLASQFKTQGVATCSAGNHGLALATAAARFHIPCTVFVPKTIEPAKFEKLQALGAHIQKSPFSGYDETLHWSLAIIKERNLHYISAFDDEEIMVANGGTLALEILEDLPDTRHVLLPIGGGGLGAGCSFYFKQKIPESTVIGCQHIGSPGLKLSLERGQAVTALPPFDTVAGAIEGGIGLNCFPYLKMGIDHVSLSSEEEIFAAFRWMLAHHQYLIEPASTVPIAACLSKKLPPLTGTTVLILTGRNVGLNTIQKMLQGEEF